MQDAGALATKELGERGCGKGEAMDNGTREDTWLAGACSCAQWIARRIPRMPLLRRDACGKGAIPTHPLRFRHYDIHSNAV
jgi:hypothetical protein